MRPQPLPTQRQHFLRLTTMRIRPLPQHFHSWPRPIKAFRFWMPPHLPSPIWGLSVGRAGTPATPSGIVPDHRHQRIEPRLQGLPPCATPPQTTQRLDADSWSTLPHLTVLTSSSGGSSEFQKSYVFVYTGKLRLVSCSIHGHTSVSEGHHPPPFSRFSITFSEKSDVSGTSNTVHANPPYPRHYSGASAHNGPAQR